MYIVLTIVQFQISEKFFALCTKEIRQWTNEKSNKFKPSNSLIIRKAQLRDWMWNMIVNWKNMDIQMTLYEF